jgi:hypothetical protein
MVTLGEAAGENLQFIASAIAQTVAMAGFPPILCERPATRDEIGVADTQNVIGTGRGYTPTMCAGASRV